MWERIRNSRLLSRRLVLAALGITLLGVGVATPLLISTRPSMEVVDSAELASVRAEVYVLMKTMTAKDAYAAFKEKIKTISDNRQHAAAHIFGELLYRKEGIAGVAVCDSSFGFGCYHSFFGIAIAERGPEVARELDEGCFVAYGRLGTGCPHGIGHGLMWHFGDAALAAALRACDGLHYQAPIGGCTDGVFMEYNEHTMTTAGNAIGRRPYEFQSRHEPCGSIDARFVEACYYRQGDWWFRSLGGDVIEVGSHCSEVQSAAGRASCYRGLGYTIATDSSYMVATAAARCALLLDAEGHNRCLEGAAWAFIADQQHKDRAQAVCVSADDESICMENAVIIK